VARRGFRHVRLAVSTGTTSAIPVELSTRITGSAVFIGREARHDHQCQH
jgi:hypothetical protein